MDPTTVEHRRVGPSQHALTAPVSRKTSIGASRNEANVRGTAYAPYSSPLSDRRISGSSSDRTRVDMPSVLQTKLGGGANDERVQAFGRFRGHTIGGLDRLRLAGPTRCRTPRWMGRAKKRTRMC